MSTTADERFRTIAERLERDLRTLFLAARLRLVEHDGTQWVRIEDTDEGWGEAGWEGWLDAPLTESELEEAVCSLASQVADSCWPDDWTDPWPVCPRHQQHPLHPGLRDGVAVWECRQDHRTSIRIGTLRPANA